VIGDGQFDLPLRHVDPDVVETNGAAGQPVAQQFITAARAATDVEHSDGVAALELPIDVLRDQAEMGGGKIAADMLRPDRSGRR
jgi:hypothetical protein